jgi:hypothetical protein
MKKKLFFFILAVVLLGIKFVPDRFNPFKNGNKTENDVVQAAEMLNKSLPKMIDEETKFTSVTPGPGKKLTYHFTLVSTKSTDLDKQMFTENIRKGAVDHVCTTKESTKILKAGVELCYLYNGVDKKIISDFCIKNSDCL